MKVKAHAKINICLNVVCRRDDGYHELEMIMVPLMLHDELTITVSSEDCYTCNDAQLRMDETNTIVQAVELMRRTFSLSECFHVHVEKHIPAQAGLAGGSADAAAVMRGIRDLLKLDISLEELAQLGKAGWRRCTVLHHGNLCSGKGDWRKDNTVRHALRFSYSSGEASDGRTYRESFFYA